MKAITIVLFVLLLAFSGCSKRELRGKSAASSDGKTYLLVDDDNGGACGSITIDGRDWLHAIHSIGEIAPGAHKIACGDPNNFIEFEIKPGTTFHFDYWGP